MSEEFIEFDVPGVGQQVHTRWRLSRAEAEEELGANIGGKYGEALGKACGAKWPKKTAIEEWKEALRAANGVTDEYAKLHAHSNRIALAARDVVLTFFGTSNDGLCGLRKALEDAGVPLE